MAKIRANYWATWDISSQEPDKEAPCSCLYGNGEMPNFYFAWFHVDVNVWAFTQCQMNYWLGGWVWSVQPCCFLIVWSDMVLHAMYTLYTSFQFILHISYFQLIIIITYYHIQIYIYIDIQPWFFWSIWASKSNHPPSPKSQPRHKISYGWWFGNPGSTHQLRLVAFFSHYLRRVLYIPGPVVQDFFHQRSTFSTLRKSLRWSMAPFEFTVVFFYM